MRKGDITEGFKRSSNKFLKDFCWPFSEEGENCGNRRKFVVRWEAITRLTLETDDATAS